MSDIVSIEIELENYEPIKFTMDEAKELHEQLHAIFGSPIVLSPWWHRYPNYTWYNTSSGVTCNNLTGASSTEWTTMKGDLDVDVDCLAGYQVTSDLTNMTVTYHEN